MHTLGWGMPGNTEVLLIVLVILLLFGAKKLPELSRALGKSLSEFKKGQKEGEEPDNKDEAAQLDAGETDKPVELDATGELDASDKKKV